MSGGTKLSVRFDWGLSHCKVFTQPLYYLCENKRQSILKEFNKSEFNTLKLDNNLEIIIYEKNEKANTVIKMQIMPVNNWNNVNLMYVMNRINNNFDIVYKGKKFVFNAINSNINDSNIIQETRGGYTQYSSYEIIYNVEDIDIFDDFIKTSISYYDKFYNCNSDYEKYINILITSQDGSYFQDLGKRNKRVMESIYLPKKQKMDIIKDLENFLKPETKIKYNKLGINYKRIYLLEGIPGSGKTTLITGLASKFNFNIAIISFIPKMTDVDLIRSLMSLHDTDVNETQNDEQNKKTFIVFEDIDCIFKERKANDEQRNNITFSGLLNALDGITSKDIICFITTNYKHNLDSALLRPGRIDYIMSFDYANKEQITEIFACFTNTTDQSLIQTFYNKCYELNIKMCTALLQQYLMKYIDKPQEAIDNIEEIKKLYDNSNNSKEAEDSGLYS